VTIVSLLIVTVRALQLFCTLLQQQRPVFAVFQAAAAGCTAARSTNAVGRKIQKTGKFLPL
jgi:hypothetical protein